MSKQTIFYLYNETKKALKEAGITPANFEAKQIIRYVTGYTNSEILSRYNEQLSPLKITALNSIVNRRLQHYPLQYILGEWSFYGLDFYVGEGVLIPRADTEALVETALDFLKDKREAVALDLCSGSGCVAVAISKNAGVSVDAVEKYEAAYEYLEKNIKRNAANVTPILADVFDFVPDKKYDIIVSNPPYISAAGMDIIDEETTHEPDSALYGGEDGLIFYHTIANRYRKFLKNGGMLAVEIGFDQASSVSKILKLNGYKNVCVKKDYGENDRVVFGTVE